MIYSCQAWPVRAPSRKADGQYLGRVDAEITSAREASSFGYQLFSKHWGQGYASEATRVAIQALVQRGVHRYVATVTLGHAASARVLQKADLVFARILPAADFASLVAVAKPPAFIAKCFVMSSAAMQFGRCL